MNISDFSPVLQMSTTQIVIEICRQYDLGAGVFAQKVNAEDLVPDTSLEHKVQFLFWVIQMDYATKSYNLYRNAKDFWVENSTWIDPKFISSLSTQQLEAMIRQKLKPRYPNEIVSRFKVNARILQTEFAGQAVNIAEQSHSAKELLANIGKFRGFGPKLANFLTRTFIDLLNLKYEDTEEILQPVDVHDVRLTYEWGLITSKEMTQKNITKLKQIWHEACKQAGESWIKFDKALWLIGSEGVKGEDISGSYHLNLGLEK